MTQKPMTWYIENNDLEGAKERLDTTNATWRSRWYEVCETIFKNCKDFAKRYVLDPIAKAVKTLENIRSISSDRNIYVADDCTIITGKGVEKCYLFEFLDENHNLLCSKVGTTVREIVQRLSEELANKTYKEMGAVTAIIRRVYDCKGFPAEGVESIIRSTYIRKYPDSFKKNDRFINTKFDIAEVDRIVDDWLNATLT